VRALINERSMIDMIVVKSWIEAAGSEERASFESLHRGGNPS